VQHFLTEYGYVALSVLAFIEACCIPIPSEVTFGFAGVLAAQGKLNLLAIILLGTAAELAGSYFSFVVGRIGGRPLVLRLGRYVLLTSKDLDRAERWLDGRGEFAVMIGRALPVLRAFTSLVAGIAEMRPFRFGAMSLVGTLVYASAWASVGYGVGSQWHRVTHDFSFAGYAIVAVVIGAIAYFIAHRWSALRRSRSADLH
jgi:membrane protein DedA with SNARE-associated domain